MDNTIDLIIKQVNSFTMQEYGRKANFSDYRHIGLAYTTSIDEKHDIQVNLNLSEFPSIDYYIDGKELIEEKIKFASYDDCAEKIGYYLDFDELTRPIYYLDAIEDCRKDIKAIIDSENRVKIIKIKD